VSKNCLLLQSNRKLKRFKLIMTQLDKRHPIQSANVIVDLITAALAVYDRPFRGNRNGAGATAEPNCTEVGATSTVD
jgi:hypothetical protein